MNSNQSSRLRQILIGLLVLILLPLLLIALVFWVFTSLLLYVLVWLLWCSRGKDILFVYSDSPIWHDYIEEQIIPRIESRAVILDWSNRQNWLHRVSL
jgi:fatty acid desaturase